MKLKKRMGKKRIKYSAVSYVSNADIENEKTAFMLLIRGPIRKTRNNNAKDFPDH